MPTIDINEIVKIAKPWNLDLRIDGFSYPVRRLTSADFKRLSDSAKYTKEQNDRFLLDLFEGKRKPKLDDIDNEGGAVLLGVIAAYYQQAVIQKNFELAAETVASQINRQTTTGSTDGSSQRSK